MHSSYSCQNLNILPHISNDTYLEPECGALADSRQLRRLEVCEAKRG